MNFLEGRSYAEIVELNKALMSKGFEDVDLTGPLSFGKAFTAGEGTGAAMVDLSQLAGGRAITVENIDTDLKVTAEDRKDLKWWHLIRKRPIHAVLDQYVVLSDLGVNAKRHVFGKWRSESAFPKTSDVTLSRKVDATKFVRDMRDITHVMEVVQTFAEKHQIINRAGAMTCMEAIELGSMYGNSSAITTQFDGFYKKLMDAYNAGYDAIIDCRKTGSSSASQGDEIIEEKLDLGAEKIMNSFGAATEMVMPTKVKSDLNQKLPAARRVYVPGQRMGQRLEDFYLGVPAAGYFSDFAYNGWGKGGDPHFNFVPSIDTFFPSGESAAVKAPSADFPNSTDSPTKPTTVAAAASGSGTKFGSGDAGTYWYKASALNADGISEAVAISSAVTVAAGEKVTLTITCNDADITGLSIYRSAMNAATAADCRWIADIAVTNATGDTTWDDTNLILPGTSHAVLISNAPVTDALDYRQLLPFVRMQLPFGLNNIVGVPYLYMLYLYMRTPKLRNDRTLGTYHVLYTNIRWSQSTF